MCLGLCTRTHTHHTEAHSKYENVHNEWIAGKVIVCKILKYLQVWKFIICKEEICKTNTSPLIILDSEESCNLSELISRGKNWNSKSKRGRLCHQLRGSCILEKRFGVLVPIALLLWGLWLHFFQSLPYMLPSSRWERCPEDGEGVIVLISVLCTQTSACHREACQLGMVW